MKYLAFVFVTLVFFGCQQSKNVEKGFYGKQAASDGEKLMENKCNLCHSPTARGDERVAPPMIAVKNHYMVEGMTKDQFVSSIQNWIKNPIPANVKMHGAVKKFGIMPKQVFTETDIEKIANYMYDTELKGPGWYRKHQQGHKHQSKVNNKETDYAQLGLDYALATKAVLGKNLMKKIQTEGTTSAISFCNVKALPLTDSMSVAKNVKIRRITDKPRNRKNNANQEELAYIQLFKEDTKNNKDSKPLVITKDALTHVYLPIKTNGLCLQCHGDSNEVKSETTSLLSQLYPNDQAIGYGLNEVRGVWKVSFQK